MGGGRGREGYGRGGVCGGGVRLGMVSLCGAMGKEEGGAHERFYP